MTCLLSKMAVMAMETAEAELEAGLRLLARMIVQAHLKKLARGQVGEICLVNKGMEGEDVDQGRFGDYQAAQAGQDQTRTQA